MNDVSFVPADALVAIDDDDPRYNQRHRIRIPVRIQSRSGTVETRTEDIGLGGAFVPTDLLRPPGEMVRVTVSFCDGAEAVDTLALVRHCRETDGESPPGMGLQFYGLTPRDEGQVADAVEAATWAPGTDPDRAAFERRHRRYQGSLQVELPYHSDRRLRTLDIGVGGMRVVTTWTPPPGTQTPVRIYHPKDDSFYELRGEVVRPNHLTHFGTPALALRFVDLLPSRREAFEAFVRSAIGDVDRRLDDFIDDDQLGLAQMLEMSLGMAPGATLGLPMLI